MSQNLAAAQGMKNGMTPFLNHAPAFFLNSGIPKRFTPFLMPCLWHQPETGHASRSGSAQARVRSIPKPEASGCAKRNSPLGLDAGMAQNATTFKQTINKKTRTSKSAPVSQVILPKQTIDPKKTHHEPLAPVVTATSAETERQAWSSHRMEALATRLFGEGGEVHSSELGLRDASPVSAPGGKTRGRVAVRERHAIFFSFHGWLNKSDKHQAIRSFSHAGKNALSPWSFGFPAKKPPEAPGLHWPPCPEIIIFSASFFDRNAKKALRTSHASWGTDIEKHTARCASLEAPAHRADVMGRLGRAKAYPTRATGGTPNPREAPKVYMRICKYLSMYVCMYACMYVRTYVCMNVLMYVCMYVCM